jgi:Fic family protein
MIQTSKRSGQYVLQMRGINEYKAFVPAPLPPVPAIVVDDEMFELLSRADRSLGRLDGSITSLPNSDFFVFMYIRKEAVLSSQIEGTQASLNDVLEVEANIMDPKQPTDVQDIINYIGAMNYGKERLLTMPPSLRLVREIHEILMTNTRVHDKNPGEFRNSQNWIGPEGSSLRNASFVPPSVHDMHQSLRDWEQYLHNEHPTPLLIKIALAHAQFETIHPFLDGNGRVGRLLITFLLFEKEVLRNPVLYLSYYFKINRTEYYDRLQAIRDHGDWESWLKFFLRGVAEVANESSEVARKVIDLRDKQRALIQKSQRRSTATALELHEYLFLNPYITVKQVQHATKRTFPSANKLVQDMVSFGILKEVTKRSRTRVFLHDDYLRIFDDDKTERI